LTANVLELSERFDCSYASGFSKADALSSSLLRAEVAPAEKLWQMTRASQSRERAIAAKSDLSGAPDATVLLKRWREASREVPNANY